MPNIGRAAIEAGAFIPLDDKCRELQNTSHSPNRASDFGEHFHAAAPAGAEAHPVCLAGGENNALQCEYANLEQCRATASGGLGYCVMNPTYTPSAYARYEGAAKRH